MATRKVKRFNGMTGSDVSEFAGTPENDSNAGMKEAYDAGTEAKGEAILKGMRDEAAAGPANFKEAFAAARGAGDKTFEYNGKKYTTEMAKPAAKPAAKAESKSEDKPAAKYQSLQDRAKSYEDARAKSGVGMYGTKKSEPKEERKPLPLKSTKSEKGNSFMGATGLKAGGKVSSASKRGDGIAQKGKTRGTMVMCGGGMTRGKK
jgi:hypothetical protein